MGTVYAATRHDGERAAVKVLHSSHVAEPLLRARFEREIAVAKMVRHPGIVEVLDEGLGPAGEPFVVMELLQGASLKQRCTQAGGTLAWGELLPLLEALLDALEVVHASGVVHRDIKPDNLFVMSSGALKLLDFGAARVVGMPPLVASTGSGLSLVGTPGFMAPEQAAGRWKEIDARTDLFAVAALAVRVLTGRHVHEDTSVARAWLRAAREPPPRVATIDPGIDPALAAVLDRALEFEPAKRWQSATDLCEALRRWSDPLPPADPTVVDMRMPTDAADLVETALSAGDLPLAIEVGEHAQQDLPPEARGRVTAMLAEAYLFAGRLDEGLRTAQIALATAVTTDAWLEAASVLAVALVHVDHPEAPEAARRLLVRLDGSCARFAHRIVSLVPFVRRRGLQDLETAAVGALRQFVEADPEDEVLRGQVLRAESWLAHFDEDFARCLALDREATDLLRRRPLLACRARLDAGVDLLFLGAYEEARDELERARAEADRMGCRVLSIEASLQIGRVLGETGAAQEGREIARHSLREAISRGFRYLEAGARHDLGRLAMTCGDLVGAERELERAMAMSLHPIFRFHALVLLARTALHRGEPELAKLRAAEALAGIGATSDVEEGLPEFQLAFVEASIATGDRSEPIRDLVARACTRLRRKASAIADPHYRETYLAVASHVRLFEIERDLSGAGAPSA